MNRPSESIEILNQYKKIIQQLQEKKQNLKSSLVKQKIKKDC